MSIFKIDIAFCWYRLTLIKYRAKKRIDVCKQQRKIPNFIVAVKKNPIYFKCLSHFQKKQQKKQRIFCVRVD